MTNLLYLNDSYQKEFQAKVESVDGNNIILNQTHFYPTSGGQPGDTGTITKEEKEYKVINTKKAGPDVIHEVESEGLAPGDEVTCTIDWPRRYKHMRGHTACHVLSYVVHEATGALITGNQIDEEKCRIDFNLEKFDREQLNEFETKSNEILSKAVQVTTKTLPREEAFQIPSVLKLKNVLPPSIENIRIVEIEGYDAQACGGTHVKNTEEIKGIEITKTENKGKNNRRIIFVLKD